MTEPARPARIRLRATVLWGVLAVLLLVGTVSSAFVVYGATGFGVRPAWADLASIGLGGVGAGLAWLFLIGLLYRVDRSNGALRRRVKLFD